MEEILQYFEENSIAFIVDILLILFLFIGVLITVIKKSKLFYQMI